MKRTAFYKDVLSYFLSEPQDSEFDRKGIILAPTKASGNGNSQIVAEIRLFINSSNADKSKLLLSNHFCIIVANHQTSDFITVDLLVHRFAKHK